METFRSIDWNAVKKSIDDALAPLSKRHPQQVNNFKNWYSSLDKKTKNENLVKEWIVSGIPKMKGMTTLLNNRTNLAVNQLNDFLKLNKPSYSTGMEYYKIIGELVDIINKFIGCFDYKWYLDLLRKYNYLQAVKKDINFFEDMCVQNKYLLFKIKNMIDKLE